MCRSFWKTKHCTHRRQIKLKRPRLIRRLTPLSRAAPRCVCDVWCQPNWRTGVDAVQRRSCLNLVCVAPVGLLMYYSPRLLNHLLLFSIQTAGVPHTLSTVVSVFCLFVPIAMYVHCVLQAFSDTIFSLGINKDLSYLVFTFRWNVERNSSRSVSENKQYIGIESFVSAISFPEDGYSLY